MVVLLIANLDVAMMWILPLLGFQSVLILAPYFLGLAIIMLSVVIFHIMVVGIPVREPLPYVEIRVSDLVDFDTDKDGDE